MHDHGPDEPDADGSETPPRPGVVAGGVALAIGVVVLVGAAVVALLPDEPPVEPAGVEEPWDPPGPMHGEPLEPGKCESGAPIADPAPMSGDEARAALPEGLVLWLRSDRGVVRGEVDRVTKWRDLSAKGHDVEAPADGPAPRWVGRAWHCLPGLRFGGSESLVRPDLLGLAPGAPRTFVVVSRLRDTLERSQAFSQGEPGSLFRHVGLEANTWQTAGSRFGLYAVGNAFDASAPTHRRLAIHFLALTSLTPGRIEATSAADAPGLRYWIDGAKQSLVRRSGPGRLRGDLTGATRTTVGRFAGPGGFGYRGDVFEVHVYDRALAEQDRQELTAALADRYAVRLEAE